MHWSDTYAKQIIEKKEKEVYLVESGVTPSGRVHAGNFREVLTQDFVYKALLKQGVKAKYQYMWDDFDRFRKVPVGVPKEYEQYIGMPTSKVPDPNGVAKSYSDYYIDLAMEEANKLGIESDFLYASKEYQACVFSEGIKEALEKKEGIKKILDEYRKEPLDSSWMPTRVYCEKCWKDNTTHEYLGDYKVHYKCECGHEDTIDFTKKGLMKLSWRSDWPMRWKHYDVDFESAGKEHHAAGGSWDTCSRISKEVLGHEPPIGPMYEFIGLKGMKEKMSSSIGNLVSITELLKVYEPELVRKLYTPRMHRYFEIAFDQDLLNEYNYFDKLERIYYGKEEGEEDDKSTFELCLIGKHGFRAQPNFAFCTTVVQTTDKPVEVLQKLGHLPQKLSEEDLERVNKRLELAKNWVELYAPENSKLVVQNTVPENDLSEQQKNALNSLAMVFDKESSEEVIAPKIKEVAEANGIKIKDVFQAAYKVFLNKERGPRLVPFLLSLDKDFVVNRLKLSK